MELREVSCKQSEVGNVPEQDAIDDLLRGRALRLAVMQDAVHGWHVPF
jgi:hypothetical protein